MKLALSTNWCNRRIADGAKIAEKALELGFDTLELGFRTPHSQVPGFKAMLGKMPVGSIHAFCPVPVSAPAGHPELFQLASFSQSESALARAHLVNNIRFAAEIGAKTVVLHAGRVAFSSLFKIIDSTLLRTVLAKGENKTDARPYAQLLKKAKAIRAKNGAKMLDRFKSALASVIPVLEECHIQLGLENLPYLEGFPDETEMAALMTEFKDAPVRGWFDTGHHRVRVMHGWIDDFAPEAKNYFGMHLNDVVDYSDDHFAPGEGKVDFAALKDFAGGVDHIVFEPNSDVTEEALKKGIEVIRAAFESPGGQDAQVR